MNTQALPDFPAPPQIPRARIIDLMSRMTGDEKHDDAATSTLDAILTLYNRVLRFDPARPEAPERDRFFLSKGHGPMAYYSVLIAHGFIPEDWADSFSRFDSPLGHHPDRTLIPGAEISSGSLGHGLPMGVGAALGLRAQPPGKAESASGTGSPPAPPHTYVLVGDAELDEGSNAEAIEFAGALGLDSLTVIVIDNASSSYAVRGRIAKRFSANGWHTQSVSGRDPVALEKAFLTRIPGAPVVVIAEVENKH